jgi:hypothetical protein
LTCSETQDVTASLRTRRFARYSASFPFSSVVAALLDPFSVFGLSAEGLGFLSRKLNNDAAGLGVLAPNPPNPAKTLGLS